MASGPRLRIGMIGCGCVAGYGHAPAIAESDAVECVAYADVDRSRAEQFASRFGGGDVYDDYRLLLDRKDIDAVAIITMPTEHCRIATDALESGKHVFVEKPISSNVEDAKLMIETARRTGRKLSVGYLLRHTGAYQKMAEVIHAGLIGSPAVYRMIGFEYYAPDDEFAWTRAKRFMADTSPVIDCGSHYIDLMRWFSGAEAVRVHGIGGRVNPEVPEGCFDWESIQVEFDDGSRGVYETGWGFTFPENRLHKEAIGPKGRVEVRFADIREGHEAGAQTVLYPLGGAEKVVAESSWKGFANEWAEFASVVRDDLDNSSSLDNALATLRIVVAGHRSALEGVSIAL